MDTFLLIVIALLAGTGVWAWYELKGKIDALEKKADTPEEKLTTLRNELLQRQDRLGDYVTSIDHRTRRGPSMPPPYTPPALARADANDFAPAPTFGPPIDPGRIGSATSVPGVYIDAVPDTVSVARHREDPQLTEPLTLPGGLTVRNFLSHYSLGRTWPELVVAFYGEAGKDPVIGPYFFRTDMTALRKHFADAIVMVCEKGVRQSTVNAMRDAHRQVATPDGTPITGEVYDRVIDTLAGLLLQWNVPEEIVVDLARVVAPLRAAIVQREAGVETGAGT